MSVHIHKEEHFIVQKSYEKNKTQIFETSSLFIYLCES